MLLLYLPSFRYYNNIIVQPSCHFVLIDVLATLTLLFRAICQFYLTVLLAQALYFVFVYLPVATMNTWQSSTINISARRLMICNSASYKLKSLEIVAKFDEISSFLHAML